MNEQSGSSMRNEIGKMILCISVARACASEWFANGHRRIELWFSVSSVANPQIIRHHLLHQSNVHLKSEWNHNHESRNFGSTHFDCECEFNKSLAPLATIQYPDIIQFEIAEDISHMAQLPHSNDWETKKTNKYGTIPA